MRQYAATWIHILWFLFLLLCFIHMFLCRWLCSFFDAALPLSSACPLHLICSGLPQPENIVLTLQVKSAHWPHSNPSPPPPAPLSPVTRVAQFYPNYLVTVAFSFTIFTGVMCSCATLRLSPSHPVHLTTTEVASPQPQLLFHLGHVLI